MFCKINDKYYVKMSNYYQELEVVKNNIVPKVGEANRVYNPNSKVQEVTWQEVLDANNRKNVRRFGKTEETKFVENNDNLDIL